jgi:glutamate carboxypeptidase
MAPIPITTFEGKLASTVHLLRDLVRMESPTQDKAHVDRVGRFVAQQAEGLQAQVQNFQQVSVGDHWSFRWDGAGQGILLLAHLDTVHPVGTLEQMPWREEEGRLYGPGVLDMKAGVAIALTAIEALQEEELLRGKSLTFLCTSDEETGSKTSRPVIEALAQEHKLVLCLEPGLSDGSLKTWRKGTGSFRLETIGKSSHAGAEPDLGINAIHEMALQVQKLIRLADEKKGTTISVGVIRGGTRTNVVPERCSIKIDVRIIEPMERERVDGALRALKPEITGAQLKLKGKWNRPPMPHSEKMDETFSRAKEIAKQIGMHLDHGGTGGASDANFVAPLGVPVLDGLGAIGEGAHSSSEFVHAQSLIDRSALLAALLSEW